MNFRSTIASAILSGDGAALGRLTSGPLLVDRNNFVERPWGGTRLLEYKGLHPLPDQVSVTGQGIGEAFELAAYDDDVEAARFPSRVTFADGSKATLPDLLRVHGRRLLGDAFVDRYGTRLPLLPKTLSVRELLSVQGHPAGHTEVYIILDADPGATIALGFSEDITEAEFRQQLKAGLQQQAEFVGLLAAEVDMIGLHQRLMRWFADRDGGLEAPHALFADALARAADADRATALRREMKSAYWLVLNALNHIPVKAGQVIYNATPARLLASGQPPSAEVHALGNPAGKEVVALEVRLPGPTFRAWDNVRFPQREVDVDAAIAALNLRRTQPSEFIVTETPDRRRPGVTTSVDSPYFRIEHLRPDAGVECRLPAGPVCLHALDGECIVRGGDGRMLATLTRGDSALMPAGLDDCRLTSDAGAHVVAVTLPCE